MIRLKISLQLNFPYGVEGFNQNILNFILLTNNSCHEACFSLSSCIFDFLRFRIL